LLLDLFDRHTATRHLIDYLIDRTGSRVFFGCVRQEVRPPQLATSRLQGNEGALARDWALQPAVTSGNRAHLRSLKVNATRPNAEPCPQVARVTTNNKKSNIFRTLLHQPPPAPTKLASTPPPNINITIKPASIPIARRSHRFRSSVQSVAELSFTPLRFSTI
jgi:hypothetical protein